MTFAENGKVGVDFFSVDKFDLTFMDMRMPVMDGPSATRAIRAMERERGVAAISIVALTASALPAEIELTSSSGCNAFT